MEPMRIGENVMMFPEVITEWCLSKCSCAARISAWCASILARFSSIMAWSRAMAEEGSSPLALTRAGVATASAPPRRSSPAAAAANSSSAAFDCCSAKSEKSPAGCAPASRVNGETGLSNGAPGERSIIPNVVKAGDMIDPFAIPPAAAAMDEEGALLLDGWGGG